MASTHHTYSPNMTTPPALSREQRRRAQKLLSRKAKPKRKYSGCHMLHTQWDVLTASPDKPMAPERYRDQLTKMHLALDAITRSESPERSDWHALTDAVNLVHTLVLQGHAQDADGLLQDAVDSMGKAWQRFDDTGQPMRLDGIGLAAMRAILADWHTCLQQLPERTIIVAYIETERRIRAMLAKPPAGVVVIG